MPHRPISERRPMPSGVPSSLPRRGVLALGAASLLVLSRPRAALARPSLEAALAAFTGGAPVHDGRVRLDIPPLVENGNAVGVTVSVDSPMAASDHVTRIALFNEKNPQAEVAVFHLGPRAGQARVATRIRLATSQTVLAVAQMSDGTFWASRASVIVTLAACIEDLT
ncbi:sulfur-oxidizing protein SoxY [Xanthobacter tagetidis]|nr:sulfur-oxidizing protein SoxY [Xanthobacter tagetidis]